MTRLFRALLTVLTLAFAGPALAQSGAGTDPLSLVQQFDANGQPLASCLLYFYVAGTVATPQQEYSDYALTQPLPNPLSCDQTGRVPLHWLAAGLIHIRLTDALGNVQVDTTMQVLGPSSGGGGGGGGGSGVDPTTIFATGDVKYRLTSESLTGWVVLNGQTIGSATSGASGRANADTQNLFVYLWTNCASPSSNNHCAVIGGLGSSALADFNANKQITLPDMRDSIPVGRDCMGNTCLAGILSSNIASGHGDGPDTPAAWGGLANQTTTTTLNIGNLPSFTSTNSGISLSNPGFNIQGFGNTSNGCFDQTECFGGNGTAVMISQNAIAFQNIVPTTSVNTQGTSSFTGTDNPASSAIFAIMNPFKLVTYYMKL